MKRVPVLAMLCALFGGLACHPARTAELACASDNECDDGQVCFPDGCGDPGVGLKVEVTPNLQSGLLAQDLALGELRANLDVEIAGPSVLAGTIRRRQSAVDLTGTPYDAPVELRGSGSSDVIAGLARRANATVTPAGGSFTLPVATGRYAVAAFATDRTIPPVLVENVAVGPGEAGPVQISLPGPDEIPVWIGTLLHGIGDPIQTAVMTVQALHPVTLAPLSQRAEVSSGSADSTGSFELALSPTVDGVSNFLIQATPKSASAQLPSRFFTVDKSAPTLEPLFFGQFGTPVTVMGHVHGAEGNPLPAAVVYVEGFLSADAPYRSPSVNTDSNGRFELRTLATQTGGQLFLQVVPPPRSASGLARFGVTIPVAGGPLETYRCTARTPLEMTLLLPDGERATGVRVVAEPLQAVGGEPLPQQGSEAVSDADGNASLPLDPATYRIDLFPNEPNLPRLSRIVTISRKGGPVVSLGELTLSRGRTLAGTITIRSNDPQRLSTSKASPYALIRFYRPVQSDRQMIPILIAEAVADAAGRYLVVLPTR